MQGMKWLSMSIQKDVEVLPSIIPILPIHGAVLLPHSQLPIPVLEKEYSSFILPAIRKYGVIGLIQPKDHGLGLFEIGSVGRLSEAKELEDERVLCVLTGLCRFQILEEVDVENDYRCALVNYKEFQMDLMEDLSETFDRERLLQALKKYFHALDIHVNWQEIFKTSDQRLVTTLAMVCPLEARERQAILELPGLKEQSQMITTLLEIGSHESRHQSTTCH